MKPECKLNLQKIIYCAHFVPSFFSSYHHFSSSCGFTPKNIYKNYFKLDFFRCNLCTRSEKKKKDFCLRKFCKMIKRTWRRLSVFNFVITTCVLKIKKIMQSNFDSHFKVYKKLLISFPFALWHKKLFKCQTFFYDLQTFYGEIDIHCEKKSFYYSKYEHLKKQSRS